MPLYFFDIMNGGPQRDEIGTECANEDAVRAAAMRTLPDIARDQIPADGERRFISVVARDDQGRPIYTATLSYSGIWLNRQF